jgi:PAS domain S-box-containing protein
MGTIRGKVLIVSFRQFGVRASCTCASVAALGILLCVLTGPSAAQQPNAKNVLLLYGLTDTFPPGNFLEANLRARVSMPVHFFVAYLDNQRIEDIEYEKELVNTVRNTYAGVKLDLVIVQYPPALRIALKHRDELFPRVPLVFTMIDAALIEGQKMGPAVTGTSAPLDFATTIDLALRLHPDTTTIAVIAGDSWYEKLHVARIHSVLLHRQKQLKEIDFVGPPSRELLEKIALLPEQTIVLYQIPNGESLQPIQLAVYAREVLAAVVQRFPTYCTPPILCFNNGGIGGAGFDGYGQLLGTVEIAKRILSGERPEDIPVVKGAPQLKLDWRALQRWHIPESALPAGSLILNRPPTFWKQYRTYLIVAMASIGVLALLVVGLLWQRARRRKAEAFMREAEERFRVMVDSTPSLVWMCDPHGKITYLNERRVAFTGPDPESGYGDSWIEYVHPNDRRNVQDVVSQALKDRRPFSNEYRLRRSDGVYRWMFDVVSPRVNGDGTFAGFIGSAIDVTDQKAAQQALEKVSGQLIEAQEKERQRIARDLHDDICQRLALLSMELDQANRSVNESPDVAKLRLKEIREHCSEIAADVQSLSHELHSSRLEYLGIVAAIRGFCHEFSKQHEVSIQFTDRDVPGDLSREISVCLFRVTQEALHNSVKYSGVCQYAVELTATAHEIQLAVRDGGRGFDVEAAKLNRGLGLVSMQERVHLVHGSLYLESEPGKGTRILAIIPVTGGERRSASLPEAVGSTKPHETNEHFAC